MLAVLLRSSAPHAERAVVEIRLSMPRLVERMSADRRSLTQHAFGSDVMQGVLEFIRVVQETVCRGWCAVVRSIDLTSSSLCEMAPASLQIVADCWCRAPDFATQRMAAITMTKLSEPHLVDAAYGLAGFHSELAGVLQIARSRIETCARLITPATATYEDATRLARAISVLTTASAAIETTAESCEVADAQYDSLSAAEQAAVNSRLDVNRALGRCAPQVYIEAARRAFRMRRLRPVLIPGADQAGDLYVVQAASVEAMSLALIEMSVADQSWRIEVIEAGFLEMLACLTVCRTLTTPDAMACHAALHVGSSRRSISPSRACGPICLRPRSTIAITAMQRSCTSRRSCP